MAGARKRAGSRADARRAAAEPRSAAPPEDATGRADLGARVALGALALVLLVAPLAVDSAAEAGFDAPKRLLVLLGTALAAAAALVLPPPEGASAALRTWRSADRRARAIVLLAIGGLAGMVVAALLSPRTALSLGALRALLPMALLVPLGASRVLGRGGSAVLLAAFLAGATIDALASLLERAGLVQPFTIEAVAGRGGTGAMVGNEGSLALLLAFGVVAALGVVLAPRAPAWRAATGAALVLQLLGLAANPSLTALATALAGAAVVAIAAHGRRALLVIAVSLAMVGVAAVALPQLRARVSTASAALRAGDWDALLTYRLGPWVAATEMMRARPLVGFGPGTFAAEFIPQRLAAEQRHRRRFVLPRETSTFGEAHDDYLQLAAECGLPAAAALLTAFALLALALARRVGRSRDDGPDVAGARTEGIVLLGLVASAAVSALTWFPLQLAVTAPALLLALGRSWRLVAEPSLARATDGDAATRDVATHDAAMHDAAIAQTSATLAQPPVRLARVFAAIVLVIIVAVPELRRYGAERDLARATGLVRAYVAAHGIGPARMLDDARTAALASAAVLPSDPRPILAAGAVELVGKKPQDALARYRRALELGERAEIDLNAGRAYAMLDRRPDAFAAFVRTGWLSPYLVYAMPEAARPLVEQEVARLEAKLRDGTLAGPPPLPDDLRTPSVARTEGAPPT